MKKIFYGAIVCCVLSSAFFYKPMSNKMEDWLNQTTSIVQAKAANAEIEEFKNFFKTTRTIPTDINIGAFWAGITAKQNGNIEKSLFYLRKAYQSDPEDPRIAKDLYLLEGIYGNIDKLLDFYTDNSANDSTYFFSRYIKIAEAIKAQDYNRAKQILSTNDGAIEDLYERPLLAWVYAGLKDKKSALDTLNKMGKDEFSTHIKNYHTAMILDYLGDIEGAEAHYNKMANMPSIVSWTALISGREFFKKQKKWGINNRFLLKYTKILEESPLLHDIIEQVGMPAIKTPAEGVSEIFYSWGINASERHELAAFIVNISLYLNNKHNLAKIWLAENLERLGYYSAAHKVYDELWHTSNHSDIILYKQGNLYLKEKDYPNALKVFKDLHTRNKNNFMLHSLIATIYREIDNCTEALPFYKKAIVLLEKMGIKNMQDIYFETGVCHLKENQFSEFEKYMQTCLMINADDASVLNYLAYAWLERDIHLDEATTFLERAHKLQPEAPEIMDSLALAYYKKKMYSEALVLAEKAVDRMGASSVANMHLGDIYKALGREREAISQYEKALALKYDLTPEVEKELLERLK